MTKKVSVPRVAVPKNSFTPRLRKNVVKTARSDVSVHLKLEDSIVAKRVGLPNKEADLHLTKTGLKAKDLTSHYNSVITAVKKIKRNLDSSRMRVIAELGWILFNQLFDTREQEEIRNLSEEFFHARKSAANLDQQLGLYVPRFSVLTEGINLPWELLYISPIDGPESVNARHFLGSSFIVKQNIIANPNLYHDIKQVPVDCEICFFTDSSLAAANNVEVPFLQGIFDKTGRKTHLSPAIRDLHMTNSALARTLNASEAELIHFACHGGSHRNPETDAVSPFIRVSDRYVAWQREFDAYLEHSNRGAFLVLNACSLAAIDSESFSDLITTFMNRGYPTIIATEIEVSDELAAQFACKMYELLLSQSGMRLTEACFWSRISELEEAESLAGYTYSYYGNNELVCE